MARRDAVTNDARNIGFARTLSQGQFRLDHGCNLVGYVAGFFSACRRTRVDVNPGGIGHPNGDSAAALAGYLCKLSSVGLRSIDTEALVDGVKSLVVV